MHPLSSNSKSWALICRGGSCFDTWSAFARLAAKYAAALRSLERDLKATPPFQHKHKLDGKSEPTDTELLPKARRRRATVKDILPGETLKDFEQRCLLWRARAPASAPHARAQHREHWQRIGTARLGRRRTTMNSTSTFTRSFGPTSRFVAPHPEDAALHAPPTTQAAGKRARQRENAPQSARVAYSAGTKASRGPKEWCGAERSIRLYLRAGAPPPRALPESPERPFRPCSDAPH